MTQGSNQAKFRAEVQLADVVAERNSAKVKYRKAIEQAVNAGLSNTKIAAIVGVSEAAIRMYRKRNNIS